MFRLCVIGTRLVRPSFGCRSHRLCGPSSPNPSGRGTPRGPRPTPDFLCVMENRFLSWNQEKDRATAPSRHKRCSHNPSHQWTSRFPLWSVTGTFGVPGSRNGTPSQESWTDTRRVSGSKSRTPDRHGKRVGRTGHSLTTVAMSGCVGTLAGVTGVCRLGGLGGPKYGRPGRRGFRLWAR